MSTEYNDEVEAISSIYGDGTIAEDTDEEARTVILHLPGDHAHSSVRMRFPATYPNVPPEVLGTFSSGGASREVTTRELELFRQAVGVVFQPGMVCLYDAIEDFRSKLAEIEPPLAAAEESAEEVEEGRGGGMLAETSQGVGVNALPEPPWTLSDPITELKSTFVARVAPVTSPDQATGFVQHLLASDRKVRQATHNITAWRIRGENGTAFQDCDDDGETAAGSRLLHLMQVMDIWDAMVVVTRWYGGQKLGPRRFAVINNAARDGFLKAGLVKEPENKKKGK